MASNGGDGMGGRRQEWRRRDAFAYRLSPSPMSLRRPRKSMSQINVVPYIDVMLVLLVIFMVTAPLVSPGEIALPSVGSRLTVPVAPLDGVRTVRIPRARFADLPRTEWRFFGGTAPAAGDAPSLLVFYQGIPDTTPEFDDEARLERDLAARIERARREAGKGS